MKNCFKDWSQSTKHASIVQVIEANNKITNIKQEISLKKIYDEVTEQLFDMSNVRIKKK